MTGGSTVQNSSWRRVTRWMITEEWRLHSKLFGGRRFAAFPLILAVLLYFGLRVFSLTGYPLGDLVFGVYGLAFLFGMQTASLAFIGRDAMESVVGDVTLLIHSGRTLPVSDVVLFAAFVVKDVAFYSLLYFVPLGMATGLAVGLPELSIVVWLNATVAFSVGLTVAMALVHLGMRSRAWAFAAFGMVVSVLTAVAVSNLVPVLSPWSVFLSSSHVWLGTVTFVSVLSGIVSLSLFDPTGASGSTTRRHDEEYTGVRNDISSVAQFLGVTGQPLTVATKTILDAERSAGGLWKVAFSTGLLTAVAVALVDLAGRILGIAVSGPIIIGLTVGLSSYTTYSMASRTDEFAQYAPYPISVGNVLSGKALATLVIGLPVSTAWFLVGSVYFAPSYLELFSGFVVLLGSGCYLFGIVAYLTGLRPDDYLFDAVEFSKFSVISAVGILPVAIAGLSFAVTVTLVAGLTAYSGVLAAIGCLLASRATTRWTKLVQKGV